MNIFLTIIFLTLGILAFWWLSGFDSKVTGENKKADLIRRAARCTATVILLGIFFGPNAARVGYAFIPLLLIVPPSLGVLWAGCLAELFSRGFHRLIDSDDRRAFDADKSARDLTRVADLLKSGRREEAVQLCEELHKSGCADVLVLETLLARAGIQPVNSKKTTPLAVAHRLRSEGNFSEAERILKSLLAENPSNLQAALMLMRLYVQDFRRSDKAMEVLRSLEKQPHVPPDSIEYARRSINDWGQRKPKPAAVVLPESVDELLALGHLGTAIDILERKIREQPEDFGSWLKLAGAHGFYSGNIHRAEKIVREIEGNRAFSAEQVRLAKAKLAEWREARPQGK